MKVRFVLSLVVALALTTALLLSKADAAGQTCGGFPNLLCGMGEFCQKPAGRCAVIDISGKCEKIPEVCPKYIKPVCGCNGVTYNNDCERMQAMVSKNHNGRCKS